MGMCVCIYKLDECKYPKPFERYSIIQLHNNTVYTIKLKKKTHVMCEIHLNNILKSGFHHIENALLLNHEELAKGAVTQDPYSGDFSLRRRR